MLFEQRYPIMHAYALSLLYFSCSIRSNANTTELYVHNKTQSVVSCSSLLLTLRHAFIDAAAIIALRGKEPALR